MKKIVSLLLTLALLCCSLMPALAETTAPVITVDEFKTAMNALAKEYIDWDLQWTDVEGLGVAGDMASNPILLTSGEYVTMAMVSFTVGADDDSETMADLFVIISALTAACPAVRDGYSVSEAPDMVFSDLQAILGQLTSDSPAAIGSLYNTPTMVSLSENDEGNVEMTLLLMYTDPTAE